MKLRTALTCTALALFLGSAAVPKAETMPKAETIKPRPAGSVSNPIEVSGDRQIVWLAIALHTTNGISPRLYPIAALLAEAAKMDLVGAGFDDFTAEQRSAVETAYPRSPQFAEGFLQALYDSLKHRPETTQGAGLADVMAYKDPNFRWRDFSSLMQKSRWVRGP